MSSSAAQGEEQDGELRPEEDQTRKADGSTETTYESLSADVVAKILSYLSLPEKMALVIVIPDWKTHLENGYSWQLLDLTLPDQEPEVVNTKQLIQETLQVYGQHILRIKRKFNFDGSDEKYKHFKELSSIIALYCKNLKDLHLCNVSSELRGSDGHGESILSFAARWPQVRLYFNLSHSSAGPLSAEHINNIFYMFSNFSAQVIRVMFTFPPTYVHHSLPQSGQLLAASGMKYCNLRILCCPVEVLNTGVVDSLARNSLRELHLISGDNTGNFDEERRIDWRGQLATSFRGILRVHQTYYDVPAANIVVNPLRVTLILKNSRSHVNVCLMNALISRASDALETFVHIHTPYSHFDQHAYWDLGDIPSKYRELALACTNLSTLAFVARVPAEALMMFAINRQVQNLWVEESHVDLHYYTRSHDDRWTAVEAKALWWTDPVSSPQRLNTFISDYLGIPWVPCTRTEMEENLQPILFP